MTDQKGKPGRGIADLSAAPDADDPDDADAFDARLAVGTELPRAMLLDALPKGLRRRLDRHEPVALTITVPGPDWCDAVSGAVTEMWSSAEIFSRTGASRSEHKPSSGNGDVATALIEGRPVVGVSQDVARFLPSSLVASADAHIVIATPGPGVLRRVLHACARGPVPRQISPGVTASLAFTDVIGAFRAKASPREVLTNLARVASARSRVSATDDTPPLPDLPGYSGAARAWGVDLIDGVARWRRGEAAWRDLSAAAVLAGPPGTGKTLFAKALARACGVPIVAASMGEFFASTDGNLGDVCKALSQSFDAAKSCAPSVYFLDEIDGFPDRRFLTARAREWWTPLVNLALTLFDGAVTSRQGVILLGATNHGDRIDPALVRAGRFERIIDVPLPGVDDLAAILRFHLGETLPGADLLPIVRLGAGASAADAARWARDARAVARAAGREMVVDDLVAVVAPPDARSPADVRRAAVHEAGHAVAQIALGGAVESVTIVAAAGSGGHTRMGASASSFPTAVDLDGVAVMMLAGRAAEEAILGAPSAGAEGDLKSATELVCSVHASAGLADSLLHLAPTGAAAALLLTDPVLRQAVSRHVAKLYAEALAIARRRRTAIVAVADALTRARLLTGDQVRAICEQHPTETEGGVHER